MRWPRFTLRRRERSAFDVLGERVLPEAPARRGWGWVVLALSLVTLMGGLSQSPRLLRRMDTFRVRQVEVRGTRFLAPDEVLEVSGVGQTSSVFDSPDAWIASLARHPMIASVRIERRLPSTVRIVVTETQPVALVRATTLLPVNGEGRVLPIAPEAARLDLPVLMASVDVGSTGYVDARAQEAVRALARLQAQEPALAAAVSEFDGGGALRLLLRLSHPTVALLPLEPTATRLNEVRRTLDDLATRGELPQTLVVDGRFEGQVVVSLNTTGSI